MKIRTGFVSNSSSSSFICDNCGKNVIDWDFWGYNCNNGHVLCESCYGQHCDHSGDTDYDIPVEKCPLCTGPITDKQLEKTPSLTIRFLLHKYALDKDDVIEEIKKTYNSMLTMKKKLLTYHRDD